MYVIIRHTITHAHFSCTTTMGQSACGHHKYKNNKAELNKVVCKITGARHTTYTYGGNSFINVTGYELLADFSATYSRLATI